MPKIRINKENIVPLLSQLPKQGQVFYWDDKMEGFGVKAMPSGLAFVVQDRVNGKTCRAVIGKYPAETPDSARKIAQDRLSKMGQGLHLNEEKRRSRATTITLQEVYDAYKESKKLSRETLRLYSSALRRCFGDWLNKPVIEITKDMIEKRHRQISEGWTSQDRGTKKDGTARQPRGKGETQANQAMRTLKSMMNYAASTYEDANGRPIISDNPVRRLSQIKAWNRERRRQDVVSVADLPTWFQAVSSLKNDAKGEDNETMRDYLLLILFTGLRRSEAAQIKWSWVDLKAKTLTIPADVTKNRETHCLPLSDFLVDLFKHRMRRIDNPYIFARPKGPGHMVESKWSIEKITRQTGVKFSPHTLRRTFETTAESLDISHYALKALLNHKNKADVTSGYIIVEAERLRRPMQLITDCLKERMGIQGAEAAEMAEEQPEAAEVQA